MSDPPAATEPGRVRARLGSSRLLQVAAALLLCIVAARAALPSWLEGWIASQATEQLGRVVTVGNVDLGLVAGGIVVEEVLVGATVDAVSPPPLTRETAELAIARLAVDLGWSGLLAGEIWIESAEIEAPHARRTRDANGRVIPLLGPRVEEPEEEGDEGGGLPVRVDHLRLAEVDVLFIDLAKRREPLEFRLKELTLDAISIDGDEVSLGSLGLREPELRLLRGVDVASFTAARVAAESERTPAAAAEALPGPPAPDVPVAPAAPAAPPESGPPADRAPGFRMAQLDLEGARLEIVGDEAELEATLAVHARDITLDTGKRFPLEIELAAADGKLSFSGEASLDPPTLEGRVRGSDIALAKLVNVAAPGAVEISSGVARVDVRLTVALGEGGGDVRLSGSFGLDELDAEVPADETKLAWSSLEVGIDEVVVPVRDEPPTISLGSVVLRQPSLRYQRVPGEAGTPEEEPPEGGGPLLRIASLELTDGKLDFRDRTVKPSHRTRVRDLALKGSDLRWPERDGTFDLKGRGGGGRISVAAALTGGNGRIEYDVGALGLPAFSPYVADVIGYNVEQGNLDLSGTLDVEGERYRIASNLVVDRLSVDGVEPGIFEKNFGMSLDLVLALLRDPFGKIRLPIDARVGGEGAEVGVTQVVTAALRQALTGVLTTPLKGLGFALRLVQGNRGGARMPALEAAPGQEAPSDAEAVSKLADLLDARPVLAARLRGRSGDEDDPFVAKRILTERIAANQQLPPVEAGFFQRRRVEGALVDGEAAALDAEDTAVLERWITAVEIDAAHRNTLATARAEAVRAALLGPYGIDAERVFLGESLAGDPGVVVELVPAGP